MARFFQVPADVSLDYVSRALDERVATYRAQALDSLRRAMEEHKVVEAYVDVKAPHAIFPQVGVCVCLWVVLVCGCDQIHRFVRPSPPTPPIDVALVF